MDLSILHDNASRATSLLKSLANEDRLLLLCQLVDGEKSVSELERLTGIRQPTLSQQLGVEIAAPQTITINRIIVQGAQRIDQTTVLSYLPIRPGDAVDASVLDVAVRTLSRTGLFADVQLGIQNGDLIVQIVENPIINQVVFEGNGALSEDKLTEEVTLKPRGIYTRARIQEDVGKIVELYRLSGRISATVTPKIVQLDQNRVDVVFEIDEGPETGVAAITFLGNTAFSDSDLRDVMVTKESSWWRLFSSNDNYDPNRIDYDREQLRKFYTNRGYYDFRIISSVAELQPDNQAFQITLTLNEGDKYNFGKIDVVTQNDRLNAQFLKALVPIREGQLYESDKIEQAVDAVIQAHGAAHIRRAYCTAEAAVMEIPKGVLTSCATPATRAPSAAIFSLLMSWSRATSRSAWRSRAMVSERTRAEKTRAITRAIHACAPLYVSSRVSSMPMNSKRAISAAATGGALEEARIVADMRELERHSDALLALFDRLADSTTATDSIAASGR